MRHVICLRRVKQIKFFLDPMITKGLAVSEIFWSKHTDRQISFLFWIRVKACFKLLGKVVKFFAFGINTLTLSLSFSLSLNLFLSYSLSRSLILCLYLKSLSLSFFRSLYLSLSLSLSFSFAFFSRSLPPTLFPSPSLLHYLSVFTFLFIVHMYCLSTVIL